MACESISFLRPQWEERSPTLKIRKEFGRWTLSRITSFWDSKVFLTQNESNGGDPRPAKSLEKAQDDEHGVGRGQERQEHSSGGDDVAHDKGRETSHTAGGKYYH
ncbi:hypothetical protein AVEN_193246-1 [Araneus ventricosus]|uniref:Uncharacterized protein n=1 Tax=Araneus ventricosus TaxID=182803 RepID=A0A4Y2HND2_ARAVE|nr:hypothetical protein AVEN_193246-1 [Araneus ventricosus]